MIIDDLNRNILLKICYIGPILSGKRTTINTLQNHFRKETEKIHTQLKILNDHETIRFHSQKWKLKAHLFTSKGNKYYFGTKPVAPQEIDGVVFVADSQQDAFSRNVTAWHNLCDFFEDPIYTLPKVVAFNKQDTPKKFCPVDFLEEINYYRLKNIDFKITNALTGMGVLDCFEEVLIVVFRLFFELQEYLYGEVKRSHYPQIKLKS